MSPKLNKRWIIAEPIPDSISDRLAHFPPIMRQLLFNRGITDPDSADWYLEGRDPGWDPFLLKGMDAAVDRLLWAVDRHEPIAVYGDFDVDGVTATALMVQVLRAFGAEVREYIPNRFDEGYGLNIEALSTLAEAGTRVVLTVDCGIRSPREAEFARHAGLDMIISDHHHPKDELPDACAVLCPRVDGNRYPEIELAGVGIAYKLAQALFISRPQRGLDVKDWLDLVALGTVADIVPLKGENRALVRAGLERIRWARRQGLVSLAQVAGVSIHRITAGDIGFMLGPRLNAAGRLDSALAAYRLLVSDDLFEVGAIAQQLDDQNRDRQKLTQKMIAEAEIQIEQQEPTHLLFAAHPAFNPGVVGLVASKLTDSHYRPAVVGQIGEEVTRASCRSIPEFHITRALDECSDLLVRHGGHAAAAGFTVRNENLDELVERLKAIADRELGDLDLRPELYADLELPLAELRPEYLPLLDMLQPTGMGNPDAVFVTRNLRVVRARPVGADGQHLKLVVTDGRIWYDAIAFRQGDWYERLPERIDLLFNFERNEYNGHESLQLNVRDLKPAGVPD